MGEPSKDVQRLGAGARAWRATVVVVLTLLLRRRSEAAGFALRAVQMAAIATYFLSCWARIRFGGFEWVNSATMVRRVRRGTPWAEWILEVPRTLHPFQWVLMTAELTATVIFLLSEKWRRRAVGAWFVFLAMTCAAIKIAFWPHLVMMLAFLPLEEYADRLRSGTRSFVRGRLRPGAAPPEAAPPEASSGRPAAEPVPVERHRETHFLPAAGTCNVPVTRRAGARNRRLPDFSP